jgi:hypothetical protein
MFQTHFWGLVSDYMVKKVIFIKIFFYYQKLKNSKNSKIKIFNAKWTLQIEVVSSFLHGK